MFVRARPGKLLNHDISKARQGRQGKETGREEKRRSKNFEMKGKRNAEAIAVLYSCLAIHKAQQPGESVSLMNLVCVRGHARSAAQIFSECNRYADHTLSPLLALVSRHCVIQWLHHRSHVQQLKHARRMYQQRISGTKRDVNKMRIIRAPHTSVSNEAIVDVFEVAVTYISTGNTYICSLQ